MTKHLLDLRVESSDDLGAGYSAIVLSAPDGKALPMVKPGQFVELQAPDGRTMLRRPISIFDYDGRTLSLLVRRIGNGTKAIAALCPGDSISTVMPLGNGFPAVRSDERVLLVGGGVGIAPLLYLARVIAASGRWPAVIYGARTAAELVASARFDGCADLHICTDDGSAGFHGLVTSHPVFSAREYDRVMCCGPKPMMQAVAAACRERNITCEVSLENIMACGVGSCLCCVEKTVRGNVCVCTEGPVFNINDLTW